MSGTLSLNPITGIRATTIDLEAPRPKVFAIASGEDISGIFYGYSGSNNFPLQVRSGWARTSAAINGTIDTIDPPWSRFSVGSWDDTPAGHLFIHANFEWGIFGGGSTENALMARLANSSGSLLLAVRGSGTNGVKFSVSNGGTGVSAGYVDVATSAANVVPTLGLSAHNFDLKIKNESTVDPHTGHTIYPSLISDGIEFVPAGHNTAPTVVFPITYDLGGTLEAPLPMFYGFGHLMVRNSLLNDGTYEVDTVTFGTEDSPATGTILLHSGVPISQERLTAGVTLLEGPSVSLYLDNTLALLWMDPDAATSDIGIAATVDLAGCSSSLGTSWSEILISNCPGFGSGVKHFDIAQFGTERGVLQQWDGSGELNAIEATDTAWLTTTGTVTIDGTATAPPSVFSEWNINACARGSLRFDNQPDGGESVVLNGTSTITWVSGTASTTNEISVGPSISATASLTTDVINKGSIAYGVRATWAGSAVNLVAVVSGDIGNTFTMVRAGTHPPVLNGTTLDTVTLTGGADAQIPTGGYQVGALMVDLHAKVDTHAAAATGGMGFSDLPNDGDTVSVHDVTAVFRSSGANPHLGEVGIGTGTLTIALAATAANLAAYINAFSWPQGSNDVKATVVGSDVGLTAETGGLTGNAYALATSGAQPVISGGTLNNPGTPDLGMTGALLGGADPPLFTTIPPEHLSFTDRAPAAVATGTPDVEAFISIEPQNRVLSYHFMWGGSTNEKFVDQGGTREFPGIGLGVAVSD